MHIHSTIKTTFEKRRIDVNSREGHHIIQIVVNRTRSTCACKLKYFLLLTRELLEPCIYVEY